VAGADNIFVPFGSPPINSIRRFWISKVGTFDRRFGCLVCVQCHLIGSARLLFDWQRGSGRIVRLRYLVGVRYGSCEYFRLYTHPQWAANVGLRLGV
jgi:hypothetical protein